MSSKSKNSDPARAFDPALWAKAQAIARRYQVVTWYDDEEQAHFGRCLELRNCMSHGDTPAQRDSMIMEAMTLCVAAMLEQGQKAPLPSREQARTEQVNIRLSRTEKRAIQEAARSEGFRGVADYLRVRILTAI